MYIEVILPVPLADTFTYFVPPPLEAQLLNRRSQIVIGSLVRVPFGKNQLHTGVVAEIRKDIPEKLDKIKPIDAVLSEGAMVLSTQLRFWEWLSQYYLCNIGAIFKAALPPAFIEKGLLHHFRSKNLRNLSPLKNLSPLSPPQQQAYSEIKSAFLTKEVCLLHGVTAGGKTEIYTHLIQDTLNQGKQVLYLLPEIALTTQITSRLQQFFGKKMSVYHSKINHHERKDIWENNCPMILGVRSSVFLPFRNLGLVIVDEEHEPSYKQQDPAPRYHARNAAIVLASLHGAKTVLGSATPSVESFHNAQTGKYGYVRLDKRFESIALPEIIPVDVKELRRKKQMKTIFSPLLLERMQEILAKGEQVLLFQNRRGFALNIVCKICDWTPKCRFCDISLTYHKASAKTGILSCHYCGRNYQLPKECPECGSTDLKPIGYGTEKVEEEIRTLFPEIPVDRLDTDTAKTKKSLEDIISRFESGQTQILIGTQMISKGLDFEKVSLVGILNADALMNFPDFRAYERAYQLMSQVAGRAGRRKTPGEVILQTSHPEHPLIQMVLQQNYEGMYDMQMEERELFKYPPVFRLIEITLKHRKDEILRELSVIYAGLLREKLGDRVIGPDKPAVGKVQNLYIRKILLKIETSVSLAALREILEQTSAQIHSNPAYRYVLLQYDVDPV
jgi:primosomal protein N' (replication factor Y)